MSLRFQQQNSYRLLECSWGHRSGGLIVTDVSDCGLLGEEKRSFVVLGGVTVWWDVVICEVRSTLSSVTIVTNVDYVI